MAQLVGPSGPVALTVQETTTANQQAARTMSFSAAWQVNVLFPGQGLFYE
jgi:hypothetical protein